MALVAAGLGVALVPRLAQAAVPAGAAIRPLRAPAPARHVFAATRAGAERRPTVAAVLDALVSCGSALSTSSRLASMSSRETRLSRQRRRNGSVLDARTLKCQSS